MKNNSNKQNIVIKMNKTWLNLIKIKRNTFFTNLWVSYLPLIHMKIINRHNLTKIFILYNLFSCKDTMTKMIYKISISTLKLLQR